MLSLSIIMWSSRYTLRIAAAGISTNHHSILEIVVCLRSFHWLVVLFHTHDNDLMAPISDLLASGNNCNGEFRELQFFWRETLNLRRIILCCLCITIFTNPLPEDAAVFFALASFFSYTFIFLGRAFPTVSLLEEELVLLASTFSCGNNITKTGKWDISHILNLRARRILQYVLTGQTDTLWARRSLDIVYDNSNEM